MSSILVVEDVAPTFFFKERYPINKQVLYDLGGYTVLYKRAGDPRQISRTADLESLTIGVVRGDHYGNNFHDDIKRFNINFTEATKDEQNFKKLVNKRIDLVVVNSVVGEFIVSKQKIVNKLKQVKLRFDYGVDPKVAGIYFLFSKKVDQEIIEDIRRSTLIMIKDGTIESIKAQYGLVHYPFVDEY